MVRLRLAALIGLLALLPIAAFFVDRGAPLQLVLSGISVLLVTGSLWLMFGEAQEPDVHTEP